MSTLQTEEAMHIPATVMPEAFWDAVKKAPGNMIYFQLLRRVDAQGMNAIHWGVRLCRVFESLRIGQLPDMRFAPSTIAQVKQRENSQLKDVSILSFGLFGPNGPLPVHLTEYAHERIYHHQDHSISAFADLFHHRLTLLFYRAWADAQPTVSLDRADNRRIEQYLAALIGMGQPGQLNKGALGHHARFSVAGHLSRHGRDPEGLEKILRYYFQVPVTVVSNIAQWMPLSERDRLQFSSGRRRSRLGISAFLGVAVRDIQHCFRIEIGPIDGETYQQFLPGERWASALLDWVLQYLGIEYDWDVRVILRAEDVNGVVLGSSARLGQSSWLGQQAQPVARGDLIFSPQ